MQNSTSISVEMHKEFPVEDDILTIEEVARYLRVSERTVYDWAQKEKFLRENRHRMAL